MFTSHPVSNVGVPRTDDFVFSQDSLKKGANRSQGGGSGATNRT